MLIGASFASRSAILPERSMWTLWRLARFREAHLLARPANSVLAPARSLHHGAAYRSDGHVAEW